LQVVVSEFEEFDAERTNRGRDKRKKSVGERGTMVGIGRGGDKRMSVVTRAESILTCQLR
jgi:hypothetical protein